MQNTLLVFAGPCKNMDTLSKETAQEIVKRGLGLHYIYGKKVEVLSVEDICKFTLDTAPTVYSFSTSLTTPYISLAAKKDEEQ